LVKIGYVERKSDHKPHIKSIVNKTHTFLIFERGMSTKSPSTAGGTVKASAVGVIAGAGVFVKS